MPKRLCCNRSEHPNDWFCMYIWPRPLCGNNNGIIPPIPPGPPGESAEVAKIHYASSNRLVELDQKLNGMPNGPASSDLIALADALRVEDFVEDAIRVAQHLEENTKTSDLTVLITAYQIQAQSYEKLGNAEAAETARQIAEYLATITRLRATLPRMRLESGA